MLFWLQVAFWVVTTVGSRLLASATRQPRSKAASFEPPTIEEGTPIAVVFGTCKISPVIAWWGDTAAQRIKEKQNNGGVFGSVFGSPSIDIGFIYKAGVHGVISWGPVDELIDVVFDNTKYLQATGNTNVVSGFSGLTPTYTSTAPCTPALPQTRPGSGLVTSLDIFSPNLMGGRKSGGGPDGMMEFFWGSTTQVASSYLASTVVTGSTTAMSAYKRLCYFVAEGGPTGFEWGNSPTLPTIHFVVRRCPNNVGTSTEANIGGDANPAEMLYEVLTNAFWGHGVPTTDIDTSSFASACATLKAEGLGMSLAITESTTGDDVASTILQHIDGVLYSDLTTGKLVLKLVRADYTTSALPLFTDANTADLVVTRPLPGALVNEVKVTYTDRVDRFAQRTVQAQNLAAVQAAGGRVNSVVVDFPGFSNATTAQLGCLRALKTLSLPLAKATFKANRQGNLLTIGSPFRLSSVLKNLPETVLRVTEVSSGAPDDPQVEITAVEDVFAITGGIYTAPGAFPATSPVPAGRRWQLQVYDQPSQGTASATLGLIVEDPDGVVSAVQFKTKVGQAAASGFVTASGPPYSATIALDRDYESIIAYQVLGTDESGVAGQVLATGERHFTLSPQVQTTYREIIAIIDGGGVPPAVGDYAIIRVPFACTVVEATIVQIAPSSPNGSAVVDVEKGTYVAFPTTASICASAKPTLSAARKATDTTLTGWTTAISAGDLLLFQVDSATTVTRLMVTLKVQVT